MEKSPTAATCARHLKHVFWGRFSLTPTVTFLLVAAVQTVGVGVTVPPERDAVAVFALVLVAVALHITAVLREHRELRVSARGDSLPLA